MDCLIWTRANTKGYGVSWVPERKRVELVHRWAVAQVLGWDAIAGKIVMHLCDNPACYRYEHLRVGTQTDNMRDAQAKGRTRGTFQKQTHCKRGHEFTEENTYVPPKRPTHRQCRLCNNERQRGWSSSRAY